MQAPPLIAPQSKTIEFKDTELVLDAQKDPTRFQALYDRWVVSVYQYFYHRCRDIDAAEDLTSQLFLSVYQALPRYEHRGHFPAWLFTIAGNLIRAYYRKNQHEVPLEMAMSQVSYSDPPEEYAKAEDVAYLVKLVSSLPEREQELIRLRYVAKLNYADMALVLHKREDAVKKSLYRLQARLQSLLEQIHA